MADFYVKLPPIAALTWKAPVATVASLPASGNTVGDARVTEDTAALYIWNGSAWVSATAAAYTPAIPGNWTGPPTTVAQALDELAARGPLVFTSTATTGGAASETVTVTGLLATDTVVAISQKTGGGAALPLLGWTTVANNALTLQWSADPGSGAVVVVAVKR